MKKCARIRKYYISDSGENISAGKKSKIDKHLALCDECAAFVERFESFAGKSSVADVTPEPVFERELIVRAAKIASEKLHEKRKKKFSLALLPDFRYRLAGGYGALAAMFIIGLFAGMFLMSALSTAPGTAINEEAGNGIIAGISDSFSADSTENLLEKFFTSSKKDTETRDRTDRLLKIVKKALGIPEAGESPYTNLFKIKNYS